MKPLCIFLIGIGGILFLEGCFLFPSDLEAPVEKPSAVKETESEKHPVASLSIDPEYSKVLTKQGLKFLKEKKYTDSLKILNKAVQTDPSNLEAAEGVESVTILMEKKKGKETSDPQYSDILTNRGVNLMENEEFKEAIDILGKAIEKNPENSMAIRKRKEAIELFKKRNLEKKKVDMGEASWL